MYFKHALISVRCLLANRVNHNMSLSSLLKRSLGKSIIEIFDKFNLVNFLDVTLNLKEENYHPYPKPNNDPLYVDSMPVRCGDAR